MTCARIHLHLTPYPAQTSIGAFDCEWTLAKLFEARLSVSSSRVAIHAPPTWIVGAMMSSHRVLT
jgi:hypothetical protein